MSEGVQAATDELYALPPEEFTAARDALAKAAGDKATTAAIKALRKPSLAAWALNQLVRTDRASVEGLIALGDDLRAAQVALSGDDLRALGRQRHQLVRAVATQAAEVAQANGRPLTPTLIDSVATSLDAALTDAGNARQLLTGCLTGALEYAGLGEEPALTLVRDLPKDAPRVETKAAERARLKQLQAARAAIVSAERDLADADRRWTKAREALSAAHLRAGSAEERYEAAREEWEQAQASEKAAELASQEAGRGEQVASLRLQQAEQHAQSLTP